MGNDIKIGGPYTKGETDGLLATKQDSLGYTPENIANKGNANGYAELDGNSRVPTAQLPSYVDDVLEYADFASLPAQGETGKIYTTLDDNKTYRWSGSAYVEISASLVLGETSEAAYRGDRGKTAYDHSQVTTGNPHNVTTSEVGLGNCDNTSDANKPISDAVQAALDALNIDMVKISHPGEGVSSAPMETYSYTPTQKFVNNATHNWYVSVKAPAGATGISSIKILFISQHAGNLYLKFAADRWKVDNTHIADWVSAHSAYAGGGTDQKMREIAVPAAAYDALTGIEGDSIVSLFMERAGGDANDTYESDFKVLGVKFTFS
jgi:hypothetical protein